MSATNNNHGYETSLQGTIAQHQIEDAAAYENIASERASPLFRGLCASFRVSDRCFQALLDDGWDHPDQFRDLTSEWRDHILALAPNGGQKKNVEKLLDRVQAGLVSGPAANDRRVDADASTHLEGNTAGSSGNVGRDSGLRGTVDVIDPSSGRE
ncbi:uncharacterized protein LOC119730136 [Patiria miniata]|uniref:Uncharacterized protein n=1 Tax=Patiria miniata TaxID=46514 RepID=A0A914A4R3_PATMI|nr:uncharacterized protein LOC119730136 [Patiria miniata]